MNRALIGALCVGAAVGLADAGVVKDNFNDSSRDGSKWLLEEDRIDVREKHQRLESRSSAAGNGIRDSGFVANGWGFDYTRNYTIKIDYELGVPPVGANRWAAVGVRALADGDVSEVYVGIERFEGQLRVAYESFDANGNSVAFETAPISATTGTLKARYQAGPDRLRIFVNGALKITIPNFLQGIDVGDGVAELAIGAQRRGFVQWGWNDAWLDNFKLTGTIVD